MPTFYRFFTLDDAFAFLLEAKGLPGIPSAARRKKRCVRACVLLSWVALEECLDVAIEMRSRRQRTFGPFPVPLKQRLWAVLAALGKAPIDDTQFTSLRAIRNKLTHPQSARNEPALTIGQAETTFGFCMATIRTFFPFQIDLQF
jgi:hypothetical protein